MQHFTNGAPYVYVSVVCTGRPVTAVSPAGFLNIVLPVRDVVRAGL